MTEPVAFPQDRTCPYQLPPGYRPLRESRPLGRVRLFNGREVWMVTGLALARELLTDPRLASDQQHPNFPFPTARFSGSQEVRTPLLGVDGAEHRVHRRGLMPAFSVRRITALREHIQRTTDMLIDDLLGKGAPADLVSGFALPLSSMTICGLLGVPYDDHEFFTTQVFRVLHGETNAEAQEASLLLQGYIGELFERREREPGEDLVSDLLEDQARQPTIERHELIGIVTLLLLAGYDTTASTISLGTYTLLRHPAQLAELRADPALMPAAVEEILRFLSVADGILRVVTEDITVGEQVIHAGEGVIFSQGLANHDDAAFPDPDTLDFHRTEKRHIAFGYGIHQCIGHNLAKVEIEIGLRTLFDRLPGLRLAVPAEDVRMTPGDTIQGPVELPVAW